MSGDHADPTILKDGDVYYMTFSSFDAYPAVVIWRSHDLLNWEPLEAALHTDIGSVWAMDLVKHAGRYFIYIPATGGGRQAVYVIWADLIEGPWSGPVDLHLDGCIDPGHAVGEDGRRWLFVNGIRRAPLSDDGLKVIGPLEHAYDPWRYPADWVVEMVSPEGPKILRRGGWFYLVSAVGGTSGPPTSHMVIVARSRSIGGPWEDCPHNPIVRTKSASEPWWSRGHASPVEGPDGRWWMVYHGYENGLRTLGRQTLLEPMRWTVDGWPQAMGGDLSLPLPAPKPHPGPPPPLAPLSGAFTADRMGVQWTFQRPGPREMQRLRFGAGGLALRGRGGSPKDTSPLTCIAGDPAYEATIAFEVGEGAEAGLLLYYDERMFVGVGLTSGEMRTFNYGAEQAWMRAPVAFRRMRLRLRNDRNVVSFAYAADDGDFVAHPWTMEVSGMNHNTFGGFLSLRPAIYACGAGAARFARFDYRAF